jgi:hypothetical protein
VTFNRTIYILFFTFVQAMSSIFQLDFHLSAMFGIYFFGVVGGVNPPLFPPELPFDPPAPPVVAPAPPLVLLAP